MWETGNNFINILYPSCVCRSSGNLLKLPSPFHLWRCYCVLNIEVRETNVTCGEERWKIMKLCCYGRQASPADSRPSAQTTGKRAPCEWEGRSAGEVRLVRFRVARAIIDEWPVCCAVKKFLPVSKTWALACLQSEWPLQDVSSVWNAWLEIVVIMFTKRRAKAWHCNRPTLVWLFLIFDLILSGVIALRFNIACLEFPHDAIR